MSPRPALRLPPGVLSSAALPGDLVLQATRRLTLLCAVMSAITVGVTLVFAIGGDAVAGARGTSARPIAILALAAALSLTMLLVSRSRLPAQVRINLGLVYLVLISFAASVFRHWLPYEATDVVRGPSPVVVLVLFFAVLVPVPPKRMLLVALACAAADPLALSVMIATGNEAPSPILAVWLTGPGFGAVVLSVIAARVIYSLGRTVKAAREMGSYHLVRKLGEGGMGEVWLARHHMLARPAAVKLIKPEALGAHNLDAAKLLLKRFELEAQSTAMLRSPNTVELYDFGVAADGTFFYVMELLDGLSLDELVIENGPQPPARVAYLLVGICNSLRDAHAAGVIHRDVKPANIYTCRLGPDVDHVKLLDFGLVKQHSRASSDIEITQRDSLAGTPAYMPPEVALGDRPIGPRTDLYAVGCVAYWLLTGRLVFPRPTAMQTIMAHAQETPEPPSALAPTPVPPALEMLVLRCLEKTPSDRPSSAESLRAELIATGLPAEWTQAHAQAWWREHGPPPPERREDAAAAGLVLADTLPGLSGELP